jgi:hypothetical protein
VAEIKIAPLVIDAPDCIPRIRALADRERSDELLGCVESVRVALAEGRAQFPIYASFPDPPDVELTCNQGTLVIEVSRVTWQRQSQVLAEADDRWPESLVELSPELMVNSKVRRAKRVLKGKRSGDYRTIKLRGERFDGPGFIGDLFVRQSMRSVPPLNGRNLG